MLTLEPSPYRGCQLCQHGVTVSGQRMCLCRAVVAPALQQPVALMRGQHGPCGPEAAHLDFPGLRA